MDDFKNLTLSKSIQMVDLNSQYNRYKSLIDSAIQDCLNNSIFIKGPQVSLFQKKLENYLDIANVITCANGTDALQIAIMALGLKPGDEVIVPNFTYFATAEVIGLLGLVPVLVDVCPDTFNLDTTKIETVITSRTKLIVPVHLFGQCADMETIIRIAKKNKLFILEDAAQAIGATYKFSDGTEKMAGTMGDIGTTSFFPSKNLGCYGDGGAIFTNNEALAYQLRMIANHGQAKQYYHEVIGVNSRLDSIQAAILNVKIKYINEFNIARQKVAQFYDNSFTNIVEISTPARFENSTHVFHQYTLKIKNGKRDELKKYLLENDIPSMVYYPLPLHDQQAIQTISKKNGDFTNSVQLCKEVLSLPIHTEFEEDQLNYISEKITSFFN